GDEAYIGITDFAQSELGELVYIEIDTVGQTVERDEVFGTVEAVKTTSELFMPVTGEIIEFNPSLDEADGDNPGLINEDPYGDGWIIKVKIADMSHYDELMDAAAYAELIG
ncbi:MAG TPA: glycine cleavage system protein GcvH, partial [Saprospiraceae bacterium]|nr:glycine cleavage system protein GcvH [Saprospiraceae bacterium]